MRFTILTNEPNGWTAKEFKKAVKGKPILLNFVSVDSFNDRNIYQKKLGDVTLLKSTQLKHYAERASLLYSFDQKTYMINKRLSTHRLITSKLYQQTMIESAPDIHGIESFYFHSKKEILQSIQCKRLQYPFIIKKLAGSQGIGVHLIRRKKELEQFGEKEILSYVCQNFIQNSGDYRVLVLGGKVLAMMKRTANEHDFRNNISQGGTAEVITDVHTRKKLEEIARRTTKLFQLDFCGVDIIFDEVSHTYRVLETNSIPNWEGIQTIIPFSIAGAVLDFALSLHKKNMKKNKKTI